MQSLGSGLSIYAYYFEDFSELVTLAPGFGGLLLPGDSSRWTVSFFYSTGLAANASLAVWKNNTNAAGSGIIVPPSGLTLELYKHGSIVQGPWYGFNLSGGPLTIGVIAPKWRK